MKSNITTIQLNSVENIKEIPLYYNSKLIPENSKVWEGAGIYLSGYVLNENLSLMRKEGLEQNNSYCYQLPGL